MTRTAGVLSTLAVTLGLAACGGSELSKEEFVAKADKICTESDKKTDALAEPKSAEEIPAYVDKGKPIVEEQIKKLKDLEDQAPESVKSDYSKALDVLDKQVPLLDELKAAGTDPAKFQAVTEKGGKLDDEANGLAKKIGLKECGS